MLQVKPRYADVMNLLVNHQLRHNFEQTHVGQPNRGDMSFMSSFDGLPSWPWVSESAACRWRSNTYRRWKWYQQIQASEYVICASVTMPTGSSTYDANISGFRRRETVRLAEPGTILCRCKSRTTQHRCKMIAPRPAQTSNVNDCTSSTDVKCCKGNMLMQALPIE